MSTNTARSQTPRSITLRGALAGKNLSFLALIENINLKNIYMNYCTVLQPSPTFFVIILTLTHAALYGVLLYLASLHSLALE